MSHDHFITFIYVAASKSLDLMNKDHKDWPSGQFRRLWNPISQKSLDRTAMQSSSLEQKKAWISEEGKPSEPVPSSSWDDPSL